MLDSRPYRVLAYHSCNKDIGLSVLLGKQSLKPSENTWDWLGDGIYFWEENPFRALQYAEESRDKIQYNKIQITQPFVLGAVIDLGLCLNLTEGESVNLLKESYSLLKNLTEKAGKPLPENKGPQRILDCAVIKFLHTTRRDNTQPPFQTIRGAFPEGKPIYPGSAMRDRTHIQICVRDEACLKAFFIPKPYEIFSAGLGV